MNNIIDEVSGKITDALDWLIDNWPNILILAVVVVVIAGLVFLVFLGVRAFFRWQAKENEKRIKAYEKFEPIIKDVYNMDLDKAPNGKLHLEKPLLILEEKHIEDNPKIAKYSYHDIRIASDVELSDEYPVPDSPDGVKGVVVIKKEAECIRAYNHGADYQWHFDCYQIDWKSKSVISHMTLHGDKPGNRSGSPTSGSGDDEYGLEPWDQVLEWLKSSRSS